MRRVKFLLGALAFVAGGVIAAAATGRFPLLSDAWSSLSSLVASPASSSSSAGDRGDADAGTLPGDAGAVRRQTAPLSSAQLGAPLVHGTFVNACGAPETMKVVVKVDVKMGRAVGVDVKTDPADPAVSACIDRAIRDLRWDVSPKTGHATVTY
jgi:hypothetical protein